MNKLLPILLLTPIASGSMGVSVNSPPIPKRESDLIVTVTTYSTYVEQTDSTPYITASGFKLDSTNPKRHRVIAISRDLRRRLKFKDRVRLIGAGRYSGVYRVEDLMNKRFRNKVDILINPTDKNTKIKNVKIVKL